MNRARRILNILIQREAGIVHPTLIEEIDGAVRQNAPGHYGDGVDHDAKDVFALAKGVLAALRLDRHARHLHCHVDQSDVLGRWQPRLAVIHGEGSQYDVIVSENRSRPDWTQAVTNGAIAAILPEHVSSS